MTPRAQAVIAQFDAALSKASGTERQSVQREVTGLFVEGAASYSENQVAIFDHLMKHLIERTDRAGLLELSRCLADVDNAPAEVVYRLSSENDIAVAGPILERSNALSDDQLLGIARERSQGHLTAIAGRPHISEPVADVLIQRGNSEVMLKVVRNAGAQLSEMSFVKTISDARGDKALAAALTNRKDIPAELEPFLKMAFD
ncbi:MAG: DUF2336 domain-containing protein [Hyphomicrobiales bacterium]|nr:DUF2336 domain-containing protein [Hyphomicrobiales bacterium]